MAITRTVNPQYSHICNVVKGGPVNARLEFSAPLNDPGSDAQATIYQGSLVSIESGAFIPGCKDPTASAAVYPMPMFSKKNQADPDVVTGTSATPSIVGGNITAYVATGGFELETTEYASGTYSVNQALVADYDTTASAYTGKVAAGTEAAVTSGTKTVVGIVSKAPAADQYGVSRLSFWSVFLPKR